MRFCGLKICFHITLFISEFERNLMEILSFNASVSFYMFHGGTNFGFMNGANAGEEDLGNYLPDITSYGKRVLKKSVLFQIKLICPKRSIL